MQSGTFNVLLFVTKRFHTAYRFWLVTKNHASLTNEDVPRLQKKLPSKKIYRPASNERTLPAYAEKNKLLPYGQVFFSPGICRHFFGSFEAALNRAAEPQQYVYKPKKSGAVGVQKSLRTTFCRSC